MALIVPACQPGWEEMENLRLKSEGLSPFNRVGGIPEEGGGRVVVSGEGVALLAAGSGGGAGEAPSHRGGRSEVVGRRRGRPGQRRGGWQESRCRGELAEIFISRLLL